MVHWYVQVSRSIPYSLRVAEDDQGWFQLITSVETTSSTKVPRVVTDAVFVWVTVTGAAVIVTVCVV